jgi:hypothetical protein
MYQELAEVTEVSRFTFRDVKPAQAGPFLLLAGNTAACQDRVATIPVRQLPPVIAAVTSAGGQVIEGPSPASNGDRVTIRHPDGSVFEYSGTASGKPPPDNPGQPREPPATSASLPPPDLPQWACRQVRQRAGHAASGPCRGHGGAINDKIGRGNQLAARRRSPVTAMARPITAAIGPTTAHKVTPVITLPPI